jgi:hypothetical protein
VVEDWLHVTFEERKRLVASIFEVITLDDTDELDCTPPRVGRTTPERSFLPQRPTNRPHQGVLSGRRDPTSPMLKQPAWSETGAGGFDWRSKDPLHAVPFHNDHQTRSQAGLPDEALDLGRHYVRDLATPDRARFPRARGSGASRPRALSELHTGR